MDKTLDNVKEALAAYFEVDPAQVSTLAIVCQSSDETESKTHTVFTVTNYEHTMGMLAELEYQVTQRRMHDDAKAQLEAMQRGQV